MAQIWPKWWVWKTKKWFGEKEEDYTATVVFYDLLNRPIEQRTEDAQGNIFSKETYRYDVQGNKISICRYLSDEDYYFQHRQYDPRGNLILQTDALGHSTYYSYNYGETLQVVKTDALGQLTIQTFDQFQRLCHIEKRNPYGSVIAETEIFYDVNGKKEKEIFKKSEKSTQ